MGRMQFILASNPVLQVGPSVAGHLLLTSAKARRMACSVKGFVT